MKFTISASELMDLRSVLRGKNLTLPKYRNPLLYTHLVNNYYDVLPDTATDMPVRGVYGNREDGENVIFRLSKEQQGLLNIVNKEFDNRTQEIATEIVESLGEEFVALDNLVSNYYSDIELKSLGIYRDTQVGKVAIAFLGTLLQEFDNPEQVKDYINPETFALTFEFNKIEDNKKYKFYATKSAAAVDSIREEATGGLIVADDVDDDFIQAIINPDAILPEEIADPNKGIISFNLPMIVENIRGEINGKTILSELINFSRNEIGNLIAEEAVKEMFDFTDIEPSSSQRYEDITQFSGAAPVVEIFSDFYQVWSSMDAENRDRLNSEDPNKALGEILDIYTTDIANPSNIRWSDLDAETYYGYVESGKLTTDKILGHRMGVVYKSAKGGSTFGILSQDDRDTAKELLEVTLSSIGMSDRLSGAVQDYVFDVLLPTSIEMSQNVDNDGIFKDTPKQMGDNLRRLAGDINRE